MHVRRIRMRAFKRFHDTTIEIPGTPKLVVMCGPNGIGKSSVIDALRLWHGGHGASSGWGLDETYHRKAGVAPTDLSALVDVQFAEPITSDVRKLVYARSSYRNEADFAHTSISRPGSLFDAARSNRMIDSEMKVSDNYQRLITAVIDDLFMGRADAELGSAIRDRHIGRVRSAMLKLFPELELQGPGDPMSGGTFYFRKAGQSQFHYKNLSGGEKAAFDLLLDMVVKVAAYDDTVFAIDEPELHMNTRLQARLLDALVELLPVSGQLWVATHSIGMMRAAQQRNAERPDEVVFLDFEGGDFDQPATVQPVIPDRDFWTRIFQVALDDLAGLVAPDHVVLCEGRPNQAGTARNTEFDARCYRTIFGQEFPRTDFLSVGSANDVQSDRLGVGRAIQTIVAGTEIVRLIDGDARTEAERLRLIAGGVRVLGRRHLESYLLDDEVLKALSHDRGQPEKFDELRTARDASLKKSQEGGHDADDIKDAAGYFYNDARRILGLTRAGATTDSFMTDTLAPLIRREMRVYVELRRDIFGR